MFFVSTSSFKNSSPLKTAEYLIKNGIKNIELSGGIYEKFD